MRALLMLSLAGLASCSNPDHGPANAVDLDAAAKRAEGDIANYAALHGQEAGGPFRREKVPAGTRADRPRPSPTSSPTEVAAADDATAVATHYFTAIAARRYREAWLLWEGRGAASGMSASAFADSFARFARYEATVGAPYDADAGAGQRFVTVPVTVRAVTTGGEAVTIAGPVVLHRVADGIDSDDPEDHLWRIRTSELKPRPGVSATR